MNHRLVEITGHEQQHQPGVSYVEVTADTPLATEQDALDLVSLSWEHGTPRLLLREGVLGPEFFRLRSLLAGAVLQKFSNYDLRVAAVVLPEVAREGRFAELARETNKGRTFGVFEDLDSARAWLSRP